MCYVGKRESRQDRGVRPFPNWDWAAGENSEEGIVPKSATRGASPASMIRYERQACEATPQLEK